MRFSPSLQVNPTEVLGEIGAKSAKNFGIVPTLTSGERSPKLP
jgi:hypothetical protein